MPSVGLFNFSATFCFQVFVFPFVRSSQEHATYISALIFDDVFLVLLSLGEMLWKCKLPPNTNRVAHFCAVNQPFPRGCHLLYHRGKKRSCWLEHASHWVPSITVVHPLILPSDDFLSRRHTHPRIYEYSSTSTCRHAHTIWKVRID